MTHICVGSLTIIGSDNGLSHGPREAIIWTNAGILSIGPLGTNYSGILFEIHAFSSRKSIWTSAKWSPFCPGFNVLSQSILVKGPLGSSCDSIITVGQRKKVTAVTFFPARPRPDQRGTNTGQIRKVLVYEITWILMHSMGKTRSLLSANNGILVCLVREI